MDALSEVLKVLRINSAIFFNARFTAPWCLASPEADEVARQVKAGSERLLFYHFLVDGSCTVKLDGMPPLHLQAGDIILFPNGDAHTMASSRADGPQPLLDVRALLRERPDELQLGGGGEPTRIICGYLSFDPILCRPVLCASTSPGCPRARRVGSRACATASSARASHSCTRSLRIRGRWKA